MILRVVLRLLIGLAGWFGGYFGSLALADWLAGERLIPYLVSYEKRAFAETVIADSLRAAPLAFLCVLVVVALLSIRDRGHAATPRPLAAIALGATLGATAAVAFFFLRSRPAEETTLTARQPQRTMHYLLVGGGPTPQASQAQIEFNVEWVISLLKRLAPEAPRTVWFGDGPSGTEGVVEMRMASDGSHLPRTPAATFLGEEFDNRLLYRPHRISDAVGSTERDSLLPALSAYLKRLRPGDAAMIIYNGHGGWASDRRNNTLRLWKETKITVRDLSQLLVETDSAVPVRFVLPQCFSGAFATAVHHEADHEQELIKGQRCGFLAESADRESEGCSASINLGDYRDYTTYFFAGLSGEDRLGRAVPLAPDRDGDGAVTPYDAHLYTLLEGFNGDLPRSTSEVWLERNLPWDSRWAATGNVPDNIYGRLAREMAVRDSLPEDGAELGRALTIRYDYLVALNRTLQRQEDSLETVANRLRKEMKARGVTAVDSIVRADPSWSDLERVQAELDELEPRQVDADRRLSMLDKLRRTRMLARALHRLEQSGSQSQRAAYGQLRACEAFPLTGR